MIADIHPEASTKSRVLLAWVEAELSAEFEQFHSFFRGVISGAMTSPSCQREKYQELRKASFHNFSESRVHAD